MPKISLNAFAKINLGLDIKGVRNDGYHEIKTVMQSIKLHDTITIETSDMPGVRMKTNLGFLPLDNKNLCVKAANLMLEKLPYDIGLSIILEKRIPVAAGLGGGSADAAAVITGMNRMFRIGLSEKKMEEIGLSIGADVPFCIRKGTSLAEGIGEKLTDIEKCPHFYIVLAKPPLSVSSKTVYELLDQSQIESHPDIDGIIACIEKGDIAGISEKLGNVLENVTIKLHPCIGDIKKELINKGALASLMSGSGPTVFGIFDSYENAKKAVSGMKEVFPNAYLRVSEVFR